MIRLVTKEVRRMTKWKFRSCPRCSGDVYVEKDNDETYEKCLQCGYVKITGSSLYSYQCDIEQENEYYDNLQHTVAPGSG
jgi:DNA-directed RNA polymerase subunit M/transcription elongation factor TFIIS